MQKEILWLVGSGVGMGIGLAGVKHDVYWMVIVGFIVFFVGLRIGIGAQIDRKISASLKKGEQEKNK
jgi:hypothetical protein